MRKFLLLLLVLSAFQVNAQCWKTIAAGGNTTVAIKTDGTLWACGGNKYGLLGDGTTTDKNIPTQIGTANNWKSVVVGGNHAVAIKTDGTLWAWGDNSYGQLGNGTNATQNVPVQIGTANNWKIIAAGSVHTLAIKEDGSLWAWGGNWDGELGDGTLLDKNIPTRVGTATDWQTIGAGGFYTVALKSDGSLWSWGYNVEGQLGNGTVTGSSVPKQIGTGINWKTIAAGYGHAVAVKTDGTLWAWGKNLYGSLGDGTTTNRNVPTQIGILTSWKEIAVGNSHSIAQKTDGTLWAWGDNYYGELGNGTNTNSLVPIRVISENDWQMIDGGSDHTVALKTDGSIWTWGDNSNGQLGNGTTTSRKSASPISCPVVVLTATIIITNVNCAGGNTGSASITSVSGGTGPYSYLWSNGAKTASITGLPAGTYVCTIIDATSQSITRSFTITEPTSLSFTTTHTSACNGSNGSLTLMASGGTAPYRYSISGSVNQASNVFAGLSAGTYMVRVQDACGWVVAKDETVIGYNTPPPTAPDLTIPAGATVANLQPSGLNFKWYNDVTSGTVLDLSTALQTGNYYLSQTINGCESSRTAVFVVVEDTRPYTAIPDINFEKKLIALGIDSGTTDGKVLTSSVSSLKSLDVSFSNIADLTGIQDFVALKNLNCYYNKLPSLDISKNTALTDLDCGSNQFASLDISKNTALTYLNCTNMPQLTTLDVSKNLALITLYCYNNRLSSLDVSKNVALVTLHCTDNQLTILDVSKNVALTTLWCTSNQLISLDVAQNVSLIALRCDSNQLTNLNLKNGNNQILSNSKSSTFRNNPNLTCIQVDNQAYSTANWASLKDATASYNTDCPVYISISSEFEDKLIALGIDKDGKNGKVSQSSIENVKTIDVSNSNISDLSGLEYFATLETLICKSNQITTLDLTKNTALKYLDCSGNPLTALDVTKNTQLTELYCDGVVQITKRSAVVGGSLASLDLSNNPLLVKLSCSNNKLTNLDLSKNPLLTDINCSNNELANLNLKNGKNTAILNLDIKSNPSLSCVQVDNATYSEMNWSDAKDPMATYNTSCSFLGGKEAIFDTVSIHPIPTKGELHIDNIVLEKASIFNVLGQAVKTMKFSSDAKNNTIDLTGLPCGVYYLHLNSEGTNTTKKIILE